MLPVFFKSSKRLIEFAKTNSGALIIGVSLIIGLNFSRFINYAEVAFYHLSGKAGADEAAFERERIARADQLCQYFSKQTLDAMIEACSIVSGSNSYGPKVFETLVIRANLYGVKHEYAKAYQDYKTVALSSDASNEMAAHAAAQLGVMALHGEFGDVRDAMQWFHMGVAKGDSGAMALIANLYATGRGVDKNCDFAREWLDEIATAAGWDDLRGLLQSGYDGQCQW